MSKWALVIAAVCWVSCTEPVPMVGIGTTKGSSTGQVSTAIAKVVSARGDLQLRTQPMAGTIQYVPSVNAGQLEFGVANIAQLTFAVEGKALFEGHPRLPGISALFDEPLGDGELRSIRGYFMIDDVRADGEGRLLFRSELGDGKVPQAAALDVFAPEFGREHKEFMREKDIFRTGSLNPNVAKPSGRWFMEPSGEMVYGGDHSLTLRRAKEGLAMAHEILTKMGARKITPIDIPVTLNSRTRGSRLVGACRAGIDPKTSVVNPYFESHDVDHLFVCDNSVIPRVTTGPTGVPLSTVAIFAAGRIVERHFKG